MTRFVTALMVLACASAYAQSEPRQAAYVELLGNGLIYSLNYERRITDRVWLRGGVGYWTIETEGRDAEERVVAVPLLANFLRGRGNHKFETGGGALLWHARGERTSFFGGPDEEVNETSVWLTGVIGYRYQRPTGGIVFRAGVTPFFAFDELGDTEEDTLAALIGLSLGRSW